MFTDIKIFVNKKENILRDLSNKNVIHINKNGVQYLQFRRLLEYSDIITHAYSLGIDVNFRTAKANKEKLPEDEFNKNLQSYKNLCLVTNLDYKNVVKTNQEHTDNIKIITKKINKNEPDINLEKYSKTDGMITNKKNLILSTTNADCILLLFFDPVTKTIANVHSGWRGTLQRISVKAVQKMKNEFNCKPENIICCICPSIRKDHFEVDKDVKDMFEKEFQDLDISNNAEIIEKQNIETPRINSKNNNIEQHEQMKIEHELRKEKWNIDTVLINKIILKKTGLKPENIVDSGICSECNSDLVHSFRAEKEGYGLETALISLI